MRDWRQWVDEIVGQCSTLVLVGWRTWEAWEALWRHFLQLVLKVRRLLLRRLGSGADSKTHDSLTEIPSLTSRWLHALCVWLCNDGLTDHKGVVTCEIKLFWNNFEIISAFYFTTYNHVWNYFKIISATLNMLENIHELLRASEIILK